MGTPDPSRDGMPTVAALRRTVALGYSHVDLFRTDPDLEPLRDAPGPFRDFLMDLAFPDDPFAP